MYDTRTVEKTCLIEIILFSIKIQYKSVVITIFLYIWKELLISEIEYGTK